MRRVAFSLPAAVFFLTVSLGLLLSLPAVIGFFRTGGESLDQALEDYHPLRDPSLHAITALRLALFREGSGPVVVDREFHLFTREEFEHHQGDRKRLDERLAWIANVARILENDGVPLVIVLVPSKARVLSTGADHPRWETALSALKRHSLSVVDPLAILASTKGAFLTTDTHWSWSGALAAARLVAREYQERPDAAKLKSTTFVLDGEISITHPGDLMRFVPLGRWAPFFPVQPESVVVPVVREDLPEAGSPGSGAGLFDTPDIPAALVGTSFSTGEVWDFAGAIQYSLQADLLNVAAEGVGPFVPMYRYLLGGTYREIAPSLVVWEIPERYLTLPETEVPELIPVP